MNDKQCDAIDVLKSIDQLRRDLSGYHGQLKAHNDLQRHCDRQREQLAALGAAHKPIKAERDAYKRQTERLAAENAKLRELVYDMLQDEERGHNDELTFDEHVERANELGVRLDG